MGAHTVHKDQIAVGYRGRISEKHAWDVSGSWEGRKEENEWELANIR